MRIIPIIPPRLDLSDADRRSADRRSCCSIFIETPGHPVGDQARADVSVFVSYMSAPLAEKTYEHSLAGPAPTSFRMTFAGHPKHSRHRPSCATENPSIAPKNPR